MPHRTYAGGYFTPQPCRQRPTIPVRVFSCAAKAAFVSRASDADRRSRRRGDAGRRSPKQSNLREAQGTAPRPSSHGVAAPSQAALAARQMRRVFVVARQRQTRQHRLRGDDCLCINISLHPDAPRVASDFWYNVHCLWERQLVALE